MAVSGPEQKRQAVLAAQLAMNRQSWAALLDRGVTEDIELRLDFFFDAPDQASARALAALLGAETDYDVGVGAGGRKLRGRKVWAVIGTTQETKLSPDVLDQWVEWMVAAGFEHGCAFDGWGAQAP